MNDQLTCRKDNQLFEIVCPGYTYTNTKLKEKENMKCGFVAYLATLNCFRNVLPFSDSMVFDDPLLIKVHIDKTTEKEVSISIKTKQKKQKQKQKQKKTITKTTTAHNIFTQIIIFPGTFSKVIKIFIQVSLPPITNEWSTVTGLLEV